MCLWHGSDERPFLSIYYKKYFCSKKYVQSASSLAGCSWGAGYGIIRTPLSVVPSPPQQKDVSSCRSTRTSSTPVPEETARVAHAAFPKGHPYLTFRDALGTIFQDEDFAALFPAWGQPGLPPWRLALVTIMQFRENLADRQAAEAVRARIDWKYLLSLELTDPGFDFSVLSEFRDRLLAGSAEEVLLEKLLERCRALGLLKARGQQRTDSTHVLAAIRVLNRLELVAETLRATLNALATVAPDWLQGLAPLAWYERYSRRIEEYTAAPGAGATRRLCPDRGGGWLPPPRRPGRPAGAHRACGSYPSLPRSVRPGSATTSGQRVRWPPLESPPSIAVRFKASRDIATGRRGHRITLRCRGALPPQTRHAVDRVHGARQRNVRAHRPAPPHPRPHDPSHRP